MIKEPFVFDIKAKIFTIIISAFILVSSFVCSFLSAHEIHHDCCEKNCPICAIVNIVNNNFQSMELTPNIISLFCEILHISSIYVFSKIVLLLNNSLIIQKTCLIN